MELKSRDTQTQIKHTILEKYLDTWGGIILNPKLRNLAKQSANSGRRFDLHFVYVDCFASAGRYSGDKHRSDNLVEGSPIIGIRALDKLAESARADGISIRVNSILIEKNQKTYLGLKETLSSYGFTDRVRETLDFTRLKPGEIAIWNSDAAEIVDKLVVYTTSGYTRAFYLIDPYGAGISYDLVRSIIQQDHHDVMINFIYEDLSRKAGMARSDKIGVLQRQQIDKWTAVFGSEDWKDVESMIRMYPWDEFWELSPQDRELAVATGYEGPPMSDNEISKRVEHALVNHYKGKLIRMDQSLTVKLVDLQFPDRDRTMFYLFLTTHDPTGALSLNKILYNAKLWEQEIRSVRRLSKKMEETGQMAFFSAQEHLAEPTAPPRPTSDAIASDILQRFSGKTTTRREVYRELVNEEYFPEEIDRALSLLKKRGKAQFEGYLSHDKPLIQFRKF